MTTAIRNERTPTLADQTRHKLILGDSRTMPEIAPQFFPTPDGLKLAYADQGRGIPWLCLAGLTRNMEDFEPALPKLLSRCRVIILFSEVPIQYKQ